MTQKYKETWELPEYIVNLIGSNKNRLRMRLGQFTSRLTRRNVDRDLFEFRGELDEITDYDLGKQFIHDEMSYGNKSGFKKWYPNMHFIIEKHGEEKVFSDLGFAIRGRIPYTYTRWVLKDLELKPADITFEMAKEVWG